MNLNPLFNIQLESNCEELEFISTHKHQQHWSNLCKINSKELILYTLILISIRKAIPKTLYRNPYHFYYTIGSENLHPLFDIQLGRLCSRRLGMHFKHTIISIGLTTCLSYCPFKEQKTAVLHVKLKGKW